VRENLQATLSKSFARFAFFVGRVAAATSIQLSYGRAASCDSETLTVA